MDSNGKTIVIGVIGSDEHSVGNKIIQAVLENSGFNVVNIGILSPQSKFIDAAVKYKSDAIIVSSIYGGAEEECKDMRKKCEKAGIENILLYIGGNILYGNKDWKEVENYYQNMGFNRIYKPGTSIEETMEDLKKDLNIISDKFKDELLEEDDKKFRYLF